MRSLPVFAGGPVEQAFTDKSLGVEPDDRQQRMAGYGNFAQTIETLAAAVSARPYIAGERFSAADVIVGSQIGFTPPGLHRIFAAPV